MSTAYRIGGDLRYNPSMPLTRREATALGVLLAAALLLLAHRVLFLTRPRTAEIRSEAPAPPPKVDLNRASLAELEALPGIGPKTAADILERRPFRRFEDLSSVPGIGPRGLDRLSEWVRVVP